MSHIPLPKLGLPVHIYEKRWLALSVFGTGLVFVAFGWLCAQFCPAGFAVLTVLGAMGICLGIFKLIRRRPTLIVSLKGVEYVGEKCPLIEWRDIRGAKIRPASPSFLSSDHIILEVENGAKYICQFNWVWRMVFCKDINQNIFHFPIPTKNLIITSQDVVDLINSQVGSSSAVLATEGEGEFVRKNGKRWCKIIEGYIFSIIGIMGLGFIVFSLFETYISMKTKDWTPVAAVVVSSEIQEKNVINRMFFPKIKYQYSLYGVEYLGDRIHVLDVSTSFCHAERSFKQYVAGTRTMVFVNPGCPSQAVLEPGIHWDCLIVFYLAGFVSEFIFALFLMSKWQKRRAN